MTDQPTSALPLVAFDAIEGVYTVPIRVYGDHRGSFGETFRREWFPFVNWHDIQMNRSVSKPGVLRGLHYHLNQIDYWFLMAGRIRVGLADLRRNSPTYKTGAVLDMDTAEPFGLFIPEGVAHGFYTLTDMTLTYVVNQYYNSGADEHGVAWDDPALGIAWGISEPVLSQRDQQNRRLADIPPDELP
jgi:dTDP-4-dehydrorhamnose 3,5-epimerase